MSKIKHLNLKDAAKFFTALGNERRLEILFILERHEVSVGHLAEMIGISQSSLSQHLSIFRELGLVRSRRVSQTVYYRCDNPFVLTMLRHIKQRFCGSATT
ncbi:MAG: metalloregulator ArsR/SmtB family transcription factor [Rhizobium sp.]|nr:metalloregulator ArsR/SmtB family transcription factor [Rhizobium sp.]